MPRSKPRLLVYLLVPFLVTVPPLTVLGYLLTQRALTKARTSAVGAMAIEEARTIAARLPFRGSAEDLQSHCVAEVRGSERRLTVVDADGRVRCDTHATAAEMMNHLRRPEIDAALRTGVGMDRRESATVHTGLVYGAVRVGDGAEASVVRVAVPTDVFGDPSGTPAVLAWILALATMIGVGSALYLRRRLTRRIDRIVDVTGAVAMGDFTHRLSGVQPDEVGAIEDGVNDMIERVGRSVDDMRKDSEKIGAILKAMVEGVVVISASGEVILINRRAEEIFDLASGVDYRGRRLIEMCRDPELQEVLRTTVASVPSTVQEREIMLAGVERRSLAVSVSPLRDGGGRVLGSVLVFHDITELKKLETVRRDFVANVSHELRTPLTAIRGYAETLLSGALDDRSRARKFLSVIDRHSERLSRLIDDLLTLSDLELGKTSVKKDAVQLPALIDEVFEVVREKAERGAVVLVREIPADLPLLLGDADRLQQVLINLTDNAVKYTPAGGVVTIRARLMLDETAPTVEVAVSDTGTGIPPDDLPRLTERFYRVDKARSRELGGTGLGLAIVKHIVQAHGGRLEIRSELNAGTTVQFSVPAWIPAARSA